MGSAVLVFFVVLPLAGMALLAPLVLYDRFAERRRAGVAASASPAQRPPAATPVQAPAPASARAEVAQVIPLRPRVQRTRSGNWAPVAAPHA